MPQLPLILDVIENEVPERTSSRRGTTAERLQRLDLHGHDREQLLASCRLAPGDIWIDPVHGHKVAVLDATQIKDVQAIMGTEKAQLALNDPPYNVVVGHAKTASISKIDLQRYIDFSGQWIKNVLATISDDSSLYVWTGADYRDNFQPLPDLILLIRTFHELKPRNIITMRNQRGYGTQKNWMWVRQELLHYVRGDPPFNVAAEYTDIPKILRGYYKEVRGEMTENLERGKSQFIRAGNVWVDVQQVFYRMEENVPGCYAQKPLKATERIILSATDDGDLVTDFFAHSGTTLIAGEKLGRRVYTFDNDPLFAEITIRRLEHFRSTGKTGWQWRNPFSEMDGNASARRWI